MLWWGRVYLSGIIRFGLSFLLLKGFEVVNVTRTNEECPQKSKVGKSFPRIATKNRLNITNAIHLKTDHQLEDCLGSADTAINNNNNKTSSKQEKVIIEVIITNIIFIITIIINATSTTTTAHT